MAATARKRARMRTTTATRMPEPPDQEPSRGRARRRHRCPSHGHWPPAGQAATGRAMGATVVLTIGWAAPPATAADNEPSLRLADVVEMARASNPQIAMSHARARAAAAMPAQASAYDDPVVSWESWNIP